ncbi:MAG: manganese efflux pump, partial [Clostridia bacterium]|nr:manganese efflux pump [Clostridia bacterium]
LMPVIGWVCIHTIVNYFKSFEALIPWIALVLLSYIGGKMLYDGIKGTTEDTGECCIGFSGLIIQGIATSIDALSVGFTIASYDFTAALISALIIAIVTFIICMCGLVIGRKAGTKLAGKAGILGGVILIIIGIEIFITGII